MCFQHIQILNILVIHLNQPQKQAAVRASCQKRKLFEFHDTMQHSSSRMRYEFPVLISSACNLDRFLGPRARGFDAWNSVEPVRWSTLCDEYSFRVSQKQRTNEVVALATCPCARGNTHAAAERH
jgi:hypothetical protein